MNILYIDIDSLRPDHLGCYGYHRNTSPNIDKIAREGLRFTNCYAPDAPCMPSRTAMTTGRFGIHTGVVNHGGECTQIFNWGAERGFGCNMTDPNWMNQLQHAGYHTVAFSPFAQRHGAWHWYAGFMEMHNTGGGGQENADQISPQVIDWLERKGKEDKPFAMWVNLWDPHTPYRTPPEYGNPFADDPIPEWYTEEVLKDHWLKAGPHSPQEVVGYQDELEWMFKHAAQRYPGITERQPKQIKTMDDARRMFDNYDTAVHFADYHIGKIIDTLKAQGIYEDTAIIISADHGENLGELHVYGDHQTADQITHRLPMVVRWPGVTDQYAGKTDDRLIYSIDMAATSLELLEREVPGCWDGISLAESIKTGEAQPHREHLVLSQLAWCAQRAARWDDFILIETYHDSWHDYPDYMLFNLKDDPHELNNLAKAHPELVEKGKQIIANWRDESLAKSRFDVDPKDVVMAEGGPAHAQDPGSGVTYIKRLRETGRGDVADRLVKKHGLD